MSTSDYLTLGPLPSLRIWQRIESFAFVCGRSRPGSSTLPADCVSLELSISIRSFCAVCSSLPVLSAKHMGSLVSSRSSACFNPALFALALLHAASFMSARAYTCPESPLSAAGAKQIPVGAQVSGQLTGGTTLDTDATFTSMGGTLPLVGCVHPGSSSPLRSSSRVESAVPVLNSASVGFSMSTRSLAPMGFKSSPFGKVRVGYRDTMPVPSFGHVGSPVSPRSTTCLGFMALAAWLQFMFLGVSREVQGQEVTERKESERKGVSCAKKK